VDLLEYQGKQLFRKHGVPTPEGRHAASVAEAVEAAEELGYPVVVKAQSTLDVVAQAGGKPANFLDAGGGSKAEAITSAVEVILSDPKVSAVLFNIFGGITRCDEVARGLIEAFNQIQPEVPFVVRLDGTNDKEGRELLAEANLPNVHTEATMLGAAEKVVELAG
jgi:succinyl-CoA synthetase beta subunit